MSSRYVRQMFEQWLQDPSLEVPYYPTINKEQNPRDDKWCTAEFNPSYREVMTFCNNMVSEDGEVEVIYEGKAGIGYDDLILSVERDIKLIENMSDPAEKLVITNRSAPTEFSAGSADRHYSLSVFFEYQYFE